MSFSPITVLIPALKKTVAFQDDLVKKLNGISLVQRAINKAIELEVDKKDIHLLTDSEEIRLIGGRSGVQSYWNPKLIWNESDGLEQISNYLRNLLNRKEYTLLLSPYAPLLSTGLLNKAKQALMSSNCTILKPINKIERNLYDDNGQ